MPAKPIPQPWHPANYNAEILYAMQALAKGTANDGQQKRVLEWIIYEAAGTYDQTFFPDSERNSAFADGKRHVGLQIVKLIKLSPAVLERRGPGRPRNDGLPPRRKNERAA